MSTEVHTGGCVCAKVRYEVAGDPDIVVVCHCEWCQRRTGTAFAVIPKFLKEDFELLSGTLTTYRAVNDFGRWLDLAFCPRCGTNIGFTQERRPWAQAIDAGTFDEPGWISTEQHKFQHIFVRNHLNWSEVPDGVEQFQDHMPT